MTIFKRLFSADYRAAVSAEAAGNLEVAAERYALAGENPAAVRMHLARASRASDRAGAIEALRDALHWAQEDAELAREVKGRLGEQLLNKTRAEGIATERDRKRVREAAALLMDAGNHERAGEALEEIGDIAAAAKAYRDGGLVYRMELAMAQEEHRASAARSLRSAFADYKAHMRIGERDAARADLRICIEHAEGKGEYRRLLDELESRLISSGRVTLRLRNGVAVTLCTTTPLVIGRDPLCELPLRAGGVSRRHAAIAVAAPTDRPRFTLTDAGSRNGTLLGGMAIAGAVPLVGEGSFGLGEDCEIRFMTAGEPETLLLEVTSGLDRGTRVIAGGPDEPLALHRLDVPATLRFRDGRALLRANGDARLLLDDELVVGGDVELISGDRLWIAGQELDVA